MMELNCPYCNGTGKISPSQDMFLGDLMRLHRQNLGMTIRDVEKITGLSNPYINQIETGKIKNPSFDTVVALAEAYQIDMSELIKHRLVKIRVKKD